MLGFDRRVPELVSQYLLREQLIGIVGVEQVVARLREVDRVSLIDPYEP